MALKLSTGLRNRLLGINTNKLTNGDFAATTTGWTVGAAGTLASTAGGQVGNCLTVTANSAAASSGYQDITTKTGHLYGIDLYFKKGTGSSGKFQIGTTGSAASIYDSGNLTDVAWARYRYWFLATATTTRITLMNNDTSNTALTQLFDEVKVISQDRAIQDLFNGGFIKIYAGSEPADADADTSALTPLVTIFSDGSSVGLSFDDSASGTIAKKSTETWSGTAGVTGTAAWFRLQAIGDAGGSSTTEERIQGSCATSGAQLNMSSTSITSGAVESISTFSITMPAL